jgi:hypothetical protein
VFKTIFLALRARGAQDWSTGLAISAKHGGAADKIEFHHIFPKAYLRRERPDLESRTIDDIANLAFIGAKTNKDIRDRSPRAYSADYERGLLEAQLVDFENDGFEADAFESFVGERRKALAAELNRFLGLPES